MIIRLIDHHTEWNGLCQENSGNYCIFLAKGTDRGGRERGTGGEQPVAYRLERGYHIGMSPGLTYMVLGDLPIWYRRTYLGKSLGVACMVAGEGRGWEEEVKGVGGVFGRDAGRDGGDFFGA